MLELELDLGLGLGSPSSFLCLEPMRYLFLLAVAHEQSLCVGDVF